MSDRQIEKLPRGGHDYRKVYAAFDAASKHTGQPTVILAHTIKGWTIEALEGKNATHQMKKLKKDDLKKFRDRLYLPMSDRDIDEAYDATGTAPFFHPGADSPEIEYMMERRRQLGGSLPKRVVRAKPLNLPGSGDVRRAQAGVGQEQDRHHHGDGPAAQGLDEGPQHRPADRADRAGRVPHVRHGLDVPERQGLQPGRPALRGRRPQAAARLQGVRAGPDAPRGHLRGRRDGLRDGRRLGVLDARRAHDPVLHLLLDVRLPADRRLDLGDGRPARARLPDRCHRGPHDADRRGAPARRRPLAAAGRDQPGGRALRPGVRLRGRAHHGVRPDPDVRRDRGAPARRGRHLLHDRLQRAGLAAQGAGRRRRRGDPQGLPQGRVRRGRRARG